SGRQRVLVRLDRRLDAVGDRQRVRARREDHRHARRWVAVEARREVVALAAELDAGDLAEPDQRAVLLVLDDDVLEFLGGVELALRGHSRVELLIRWRGLLADLARR